MTYRELLLQAELKLDHNDITLGEFEQMIAPLNREVDVLDKIRTEIENDWQLKKYPSSPFSCGLRRAIEIIDKYRNEVSE